MGSVVGWPILQNTEDVVTRLLFFELSMPRAVWLLVTFAVGVATGILITVRLKRKGTLPAQQTA